MDRGVAFSRVEDADTLPACFEDEPPSFRGRWRKLACYAALLCCNQIAWISYATVPADSAKVLGVSPALVTLLAASYSILYLPGSVLAARALHRGGLRCCLLESARLMVAGTLLKVAGTVVVVVAPAPGARALAYALSLFGQVLLASAQPHLVNTPTAVAQAFFPAAERDFAGILGLLGPVVGQALGEALAPAVVCGVQQRGGSAAAGLLTLNILQLFPLSVAAVLAANLFSGNAARKPSKQGASLFADWWRLVRSDANLRTLWVAVCVGMSIFNALLAMAAQWLAPCGYGAATVGYFMATFVAVGIPTAALTGLHLDRTRVPSKGEGIAGHVPLGLSSYAARRRARGRLRDGDPPRGGAQGRNRLALFGVWFTRGSDDLHACDRNGQRQGNHQRAIAQRRAVSQRLDARQRRRGPLCKDRSGAFGPSHRNRKSRRTAILGHGGRSGVHLPGAARALDGFALLRRQRLYCRSDVRVPVDFTTGAPRLHAARIAAAGVAGQSAARMLHARSHVRLRRTLPHVQRALPPPRRRAPRRRRRDGSRCSRPAQPIVRACRPSRRGRRESRPQRCSFIVP